MNRFTDYSVLETSIVSWIQKYVENNPSIEALVIGVSGGIDSAVSSTLAAKTGLPVYALGMPIHQNAEQENLSDAHLEWLRTNFNNVTVLKYDLTSTFDTFKNVMGDYGQDLHALANTRSRLRMVTLYQIAGSVNGIVVGTGNGVEDYGVGFYTKYGDGGVDISPIADLFKTEVRELGKHFGVDQRIIDAPPTDGLWDDGRTDESQLGTTYEMLEWVMETQTLAFGGQLKPIESYDGFTEEQVNAIRAYERFNTQNQHKIRPVPLYTLATDYDGELEPRENPNQEEQLN